VKPSSFEYEAPDTLARALDSLAAHGESAKVLAGGQSLVPLLNLRLAQPERIVDINGVAELDYIRQEDHSLRIGALTRHVTLERSALVATELPLLTNAIRLVGHAQIRNRGTVGGSIAHADPAAELPAVFLALDAYFHIRSASNERVVAAKDFFVTYLTTAIAPDELLTEIEVRLPREGTRTSIIEFSRRHGDFALAGAAVTMHATEANVCDGISIALLSAGSTPLKATTAEAFLQGQQLTSQAIAEASSRAADEIQSSSSTSGSANYHRQLVTTMVSRALIDALHEK
jgi:CO/xanthine dehydrogenase FAD-binding subunit